MLLKSVRSRPSPHTFQPILDLVYQRLVHKNNNNDNNNETRTDSIKIAVLGGSVTRGQKCYESPVRGGKLIGPTECAWPYRLESLVNSLAGFPLIKVYNLAISATDITFGTSIVKYWFYPTSLLPDGPDVIISAFATNEQVLGVDTTKSVDFANEKRQRVQDFILSSLQSRPCRPPLVLFLDDYMGNLQDHILGEMTYGKVVTELSEWYNIMHISYADVIRRAVYANMDEANFSPSWPLETEGESAGKPKTEVHFGMGGHIAIVWVIVFALVDAICSYCDNEDFVKQIVQKENRKGSLPETVKDLMNKVPPPRLTPELLLQNVTREWLDKAIELRSSRANCGRAPSLSDSPCAFAFLAGMGCTVQKPAHLYRYLEPYTINNTGWEPASDYATGGFINKLGLVATDAHASMTLYLKNIEKEVRIINLQALKSYGEKWAGSKARFTLNVENQGRRHQSHFEVEGFHDFETSVSYPFEYDLKENKAEIGSNVTLSLDLIGGTTFKIIGMMLCNR